jgi:hypothetical protein
VGFLRERFGPQLTLLHADALGISETRTTGLERLEARGQSAVFRRLADSGGTGARRTRPQKIVATLQLEVAQRLMAQGTKRLRLADVAGAIRF